MRGEAPDAQKSVATDRHVCAEEGPHAEIARLRSVVHECQRRCQPTEAVAIERQPPRRRTFQARRDRATGERKRGILHRGTDRLEPCRVHTHVVIGECENVAGGDAQRPAERVRFAWPWFFEIVERNAEGALVSSSDRRRIVGRPVVYDENLVARSEALARQVRQAVVQQRGPIVSRDHDANRHTGAGMF